MQHYEKQKKNDKSQGCMQSQYCCPHESYFLLEFYTFPHNQPAETERNIQIYIQNNCLRLHIILYDRSWVSLHSHGHRNTSQEYELSHVFVSGSFFSQLSWQTSKHCLHAPEQTPRASTTSFSAVFSLTLPCPHYTISRTWKAIWIGRGKKGELGMPKYLRKAWLKALLLGQRRRCQTGVLGIEQMTCIHVKCWDLSCSTSGREIQLVPDSQPPCQKGFCHAATVSPSHWRATREPGRMSSTGEPSASKALVSFPFQPQNLPGILNPTQKQILARKRHWGEGRVRTCYTVM